VVSCGAPLGETCAEATRRWPRRLSDGVQRGMRTVSEEARASEGGACVRGLATGPPGVPCLV